MIIKSSGTGILNQSITTIKHNATEHSGSTTNELNQTHTFQLAHPQTVTSPIPSTACCQRAPAPPPVRIHQSVQFISIATTKPVTQVIQSPATSVSLSANLSHAVCNPGRQITQHNQSIAQYQCDPQTNS